MEQHEQKWLDSQRTPDDFRELMEARANGLPARSRRKQYPIRVWSATKEPVSDRDKYAYCQAHKYVLSNPETTLHCGPDGGRPWNPVTVDLEPLEAWQERMVVVVSYYDGLTWGDLSDNEIKISDRTLIDRKFDKSRMNRTGVSITPPPDYCALPFGGCD